MPFIILIIFTKYLVCIAICTFPNHTLTKSCFLAFIRVPLFCRITGKPAYFISPRYLQNIFALSISAKKITAFIPEPDNIVHECVKNWHDWLAARNSLSEISETMQSEMNIYMPRLINAVSDHISISFKYVQYIWKYYALLYR